MSKFEQALADKDFVLTVELDPPRGVALAPLLELAGRLAPRVDALVVSDNRGAMPRLSALAAATRLAAQGAEVVLTLTCRDMNRLALTSQMLAAGAAGIGNLLLVSGDYVSLGDHPGAKPVYDLDSVQALGLAVTLASGRDLAGQELDGAPSFCLGAAVAAQSDPLPPQLIKLKKKAQAGARFIVTQPLNGLEELQGFCRQTATLGVKVLAGLEVADPGQRQGVVGLLREIRGSGLVAGAHLSMPAAQDDLPALLDACGL
ncbi:MAG: methylenetetrahydrofolate reductase [Desulfarculus sp.]|nr:methylenetetrahydrofolate reductase [Desulfarculus sp.]